MSTIINRHAPRILRLQLRLPSGKRRWKLVKVPNFEKSPNDSIFGLHARLATLTVEGRITAGSVIVPANITDKQRERLHRWPEVIGDMLWEDVD